MESQICESITIFMSLVRLKKVLSLFSSLYVPVFEPLRFVEVIVILLADRGLWGLIVSDFCGGHMSLNTTWCTRGGGERGYCFLLYILGGYLFPYRGSDVACFLVRGLATEELKSYSLKGLVLGVYVIKVVLFVGQRNSQ